MNTTANFRSADYAIDPLFLERWSPRAFTEEMISERDLMTLLEAARWAPSSYNSQPWRFIYARRGSGHWDRLLGLLVPFNQAWAKNASALVYVVSDPMMRHLGTDQPVYCRSHSFDAGAAWGSLALQGTLSGWHAHAMAGIDFEKAETELAVPKGYRIEAAVAIGRQGSKSQLPEALKAREHPSQRQPLSEIVFEGRFIPDPRTGFGIKPAPTA